MYICCNESCNSGIRFFFMGFWWCFWAKSGVDKVKLKTRILEVIKRREYNTIKKSSPFNNITG